MPPMLNDIHSQLNATEVAAIVRPSSTQELSLAIRRAKGKGRAVSLSGGRHAMGGQQFGTAALHIDMRGMNHVLDFDRQRGLIETEAGILWPELIEWYLDAQRNEPRQWGIAQKPTGADRLSLGGCLSSNIHGRGLTLAPFASNVEAFTLIDALGEAHRCSRTENAELFSLAIGGYGLFGAIASVQVRLAPRRKLRRSVEIREADGLIRAFESRIAEGALYGDFQFEIDPRSPGFLRRGVFASYSPVPDETPIPDNQRQLEMDDWCRLLYLAHTNKSLAFELYSQHYLATAGQVYWSDTHQLSIYGDDYHRELDPLLNAGQASCACADRGGGRHTCAAHSGAGATVRGSEMIGELYVPREELDVFLTEAAAGLRATGADVIYGTVRLIERDSDSFLAWAREPWACVVFNVHVDHTPDGVARAGHQYRLLNRLAIARGGSFYLTYHRWATREQLLACYPNFPDFLEHKLRYDPGERFQSDWYRHHRALIGAQAAYSPA